MSSRLTPRSCASASAIALCVVDVTFCANSRGFVNFSHCESVTPAGLANFNAHATDAAPPKILAAASPNSSRAGEVQKVCPDRREPAFIVAFCVRKADLQVGDNCCSRTLVEDIRFGNVKGPGADEVALGLAFTSHGHLVIAMGLRDATSLAPAVRGSPRLLHSARPLLRELEQIRDEARCREQGGDDCGGGGASIYPCEGK